jgi:sarcosine oxidase subunit delta
MGLKIPCPRCGPRDHSEFTFGGEVRPAEEASDPHAEFQRVFHRTNAPGLQEERWFHLLGCRRWVSVRRNTVTNEMTDG